MKKVINFLADFWQAVLDGERDYNEKMYDLYGGNDGR